MNRVEKLIDEFEGNRLRAYLDPVGIWTIGRGHTGPEVKPGLVWTEEQSLMALRLDIQTARHIVKQGVARRITDSMMDALISFVFNVGPGGPKKDGFLVLKNGQHSTLRRKINGGVWDMAANEFPKWNKGTVDGRLISIAGLTRRRAAERELFLSEKHLWPEFLADGALGSHWSDL